MNVTGLQRRGLLDELANKGVRVTAQRRAVVEEIQNAERHLDAAELLKRATRRDAKVNRATVYRTLNLLKSCGLIDELDLMHLEGEKHYYEAKPQRDHVHLACTECGRIEEFRSAAYDQLKREVEERCGFRIDIARFEAGGRCRSCQGRENRKREREAVNM